MRRTVPIWCALPFASGALWAQQYVVSTVAGGGLPQNIPGTSANLDFIRGLAVDPTGNVLISLSSYNAVLRLDTHGLLSVIAGNGNYGRNGDGGAAINAQLGQPQGLALDSAGNLYVGQGGLEAVVRKITPTGVITTVAGGGTPGSGISDGALATSGSLIFPTHIAVDGKGNIYIDQGSRIRMISSGIITTVAGAGPTGYSGDSGPALGAALGGGNLSVAVDGAGNIYISDDVNNVVRRVTNGIITTVAGTGVRGFSGDGGQATSAQLSSPEGITVDAAGNLYIADQGNQRVRKVSSGVITTVGASGILGLAPALSVDTEGNLYIAGNGGIVSQLTPGGVFTALAGGGQMIGDSGPAIGAQLLGPRGIAVDSNGTVYIATQNRIRQVSNGLITTIAGTGQQGFGGDGGPATSASLNFPYDVAVDSTGILYISDYNSNRIRKVSGNVITTIAGTGIQGYSGDGGPATSSELSLPNGVAVDSLGNLYIADNGNHRIRKVSNGLITTVAGNGSPGFSGDGGSATSAQLNGPTSVAIDRGGNLYIADNLNSRVRKVSNGIITTVAGTGSGLDGGDGGPAASAQVTYPTHVAVDTAGNLYISETAFGAFNGFAGNRIRKVTNGIITTIAGSVNVYDYGFSGDNGPATSAQFAGPWGLAIDSVGRVYVSDEENNRIRVLSTGTLISSVENAASNLPGPIAPGEIIVIYGSGLGPVQLTEYHIGTSGLIDCQLSGTTVQINGMCAPIVYTSATQVAAIVPYAVSNGTAQITVTYQGQATVVLPVAALSSSPGIFTLDSTGKGAAACVNQDGSINSASTPAKIGDVVACFATGEGQTSPAGVDGKPAAVPLPQPILPVSATIGGQMVKPQYAGGAPGEVAGVMQVNFQIPPGIQSSSAVPVMLTVGSASSQAGVTIAVK